MQIHNLKRKNKNKRSVAVGRGGTRGKTSGKGTKGQNARAGRKKRPEIRDVIKRLPKLRGRGIAGLKSFQRDVYAVNVTVLNSIFKSGDVVTPKTLVEKGILSTVSGNYPRVKILGTGDIDKKLIIRSCDVSASAKTKIEKAQGSVE
jgi:large subunit ribosomal protein L15